MSENQPQLPANILHTLQLFANTAWHNPSAFQRIHHSDTGHDVEYLHLQDHSVALRYLFGNTLGRRNKILVRNEYREALQALQTDPTYEQGAYIIGQPGIGKTNFLIYTLVERLRKHKPVVVQLRTADPFYAAFTYTCTLYALSDPSPLVQQDVWALSDLRSSTSVPLDIFQDVSAKVVQATLPNVKYWERWSQYRGAHMYVMNTWSEEEIEVLSSLLELDDEHMTSLCAKWGGVPRTILQQSANSKSRQDWELHRAAMRVVNNYTTFLPALYALDAQDVGTTSTIFFVLPFEDRVGTVRRDRYVVRVPTTTLENALAVALQQMQSESRIDFFRLMSVQPGTRSCARNIYIRWLHTLLASPGGPFQIQWPVYDSSLSTALGSVQAGQLSIVRDAAAVTNPPCFWIAPSGEFPGIDCALIARSGVFAIQVPMCFQPLSTSPKIGLDKLRKNLPAAWQTHVSWRFLIVGISDDLTLPVWSYWKNNFRSENVTFGHRCVVDPAEVGIPHKAYTEDEDLEVGDVD